VTGRLRSPRFLAATGLILLWWGASAALALGCSGRIRDWAVMTDELQYAKLALSVAEARSPLPSIHGTTVSVANQLYPVVIAPLYGSLSSPDAFRAAHVSNAFVMTSAAFPAYLLGRQVLDRGPSFAVALLTVVTPWMVLTGVLMSEVVAYPAFLWAILCFHRAIVDPSTRRDLLAAAALAVAVLARTQFAVLALVLPLAILAHELVAERAPTERGARTPVPAGARAAVRRHRALGGVYAAGAILAVAASLAGYRVFGAYTTTVEGGTSLPAAVWTSAVHISTSWDRLRLVPSSWEAGGFSLRRSGRCRPTAMPSRRSRASRSSRSRSRRRPSTCASAARRSSATATSSTSSRCCSSHRRQRSPRSAGGPSRSARRRSRRRRDGPQLPFLTFPACRSTRS
jgi:hypothetical protein